MTEQWRELLAEESDFCGCCGRQSSGAWCLDCNAHVASASDHPLWERTYFARTGMECPFQVDVSAAPDRPGELDDARTYDSQRVRDEYDDDGLTLADLADLPERSDD